MIASYSLKEIAWKRILFFLFLIIIPNYLVMQVQLVGPVDDMVGLGTALILNGVFVILKHKHKCN